MSDKKHNLSKAELAALDFMIAYMQQNNKTQLGGFIDSIVDAVTNVANKVADVATNAAQQATNIVNTATNAAQNVANTVANAVGGVKGTEAQSFLQKFHDENLHEEVTLEELIKIRNQYK